jgi:hypothetical protein
MVPIYYYKSRYRQTRGATFSVSNFSRLCYMLAQDEVRSSLIEFGTNLTRNELDAGVRREVLHPVDPWL